MRGGQYLNRKTEVYDFETGLRDFIIAFATRIFVFRNTKKHDTLLSLFRRSMYFLIMHSLKSGNQMGL